MGHSHSICPGNRISVVKEERAPGPLEYGNIEQRSGFQDMVVSSLNA